MIRQMLVVCPESSPLESWLPSMMTLRLQGLGTVSLALIPSWPQAKAYDTHLIKHRLHLLSENDWFEDVHVTQVERIGGHFEISASIFKKENVSPPGS